MRRLAGSGGFTLVEMVLSLVIVTVVLLGLASATAFFVRVTGMGERRAVAIQLAEDRIETIRLDPEYAALEARYELTESNFARLPGYTRETSIVRVGGTGEATDHKKVTVRVIGPGLAGSVDRTISVAAP